MPRFHVPGPLAADASVVLPRTVVQHALRALRLEDGSPITLFDGLGGEYSAVLRISGANHADALITGFDAREAELPFAVTVAQGLSGGDKMDWTIEKAVELGATAIQPLAAARSVVRLTAERADKRREHWQALVRASCEQCGRNRVPAVHAVLKLDAWLAACPRDALKLLLSPRGGRALTAVPMPAAGRPVVLLVGPEGGWSPEEEGAAVAAGFEAVSIGPRVLRTETAAAAALAMLAACWGGV